MAADPHALAVMVLTVCALVLFAQSRIRIETSSLAIFVLLVVGFQLFPYVGPSGLLRPADLFLGFGHEALVAVCALMVLGKGLETTGALRPLARVLARLWRTSPSISLLATLFIAAVLSAVVNNTPIVVMLLPLLVAATISAKTDSSGVLLPFGLATVVGGAMTTIGTSTNLLVVSVARDMGVKPFGIFDFTLPLAIVGLGALFFLWLVAPRLLPSRATPLSDKSARLYAAVLYVEEESTIVGKNLAHIRKMAGGDLKLVEVQRGKGIQLARMPTLTFAVGDRLHVMDAPDRLKELESLFKAPLHDVDEDELEEAFAAEALAKKSTAAEAGQGAEATEGAGGAENADSEPDTEPEAQESAEDAKQTMVEVVVTEDSPLNNATLRRVRFADEYGLFVLAVHRGQWQPEVRRSELGDLLLKTGDVLLVQGAQADIVALKSSRGFLVLDSKMELPDTARAMPALAIMSAVIISAAFGLLPIAVAALLGVTAMIITGCLGWREVSKALSSQVIMIVVTSLALGTALTVTGGTIMIANAFVMMTDGLSPVAILGALMLLMAVFTNILSNNAAGIIGTPIALSIAATLGLAPEPFVIAIIAGVNMSFATPMAYQTNLLIMNAGGYRFMDFVRVGVPLTLLMWAGYMVVIPLFFPF